MIYIVRNFFFQRATLIRHSLKGYWCLREGFGDLSRVLDLTLPTRSVIVGLGFSFVTLNLVDRTSRQNSGTKLSVRENLYFDDCRFSLET